MLLPDQTYEQCQQILLPLKAIRKILKDSACIDGGPSSNEPAENGTATAKLTASPNITDDCTDDYLRTAEFFNNIPDFTGDPLGPFSLPDKTADATDPVRHKASADVLKECELFLFKHRIRPDFFCRYRKGQE